MRVIKYYIKDIYSKPLVYVADKKEAQALQLLTDRKTLTRSDMEALRQLGFDFEEVTRKEVES
jgi:hypothetical protein